MQKLKLFLGFFLFILLLHSCQQESNQTTHLRHVGDILYDAKIDDPNFKPCHEDFAFQYYNLGKGVQYEGEKPALDSVFYNAYQSESKKTETGYITIRFMVNCKGETGWFRVEEIDTNYQPKEFDKDIVEQLLQLTKSLEGWKIGDYDGEQLDYYQYLTFKLEEGQISHILP